MRRITGLSGLWIIVITAGLALAACQANTSLIEPEEDLEEESPPENPTATDTPTNTPSPTPPKSATPEPTATEVKPLVELDDEIADTVNCVTNGEANVPAVDVQHVTVWNNPAGGYLVDVFVGEPVEETITTAFSFAINVTAETASQPILLRGFGFGIHDGNRFQGEYEATGSRNLIADTQHFVQINPETGMPRFFLPVETKSFKVEAFYKATADAADPVICDPIQEAQDYIIRY